MQGKSKNVLHIFALMIILLLSMALSACNKSECKHNYSSEITKEATCTERGVRTYTCKLCGDSYTVPIMFIGHDEIMYAAKSPSCSEIGWDAYIECQRDGCDYSTKIEKPMLEHNYVAVVNSPTCTRKGYTTYTCFCGNSYNGDYEYNPFGEEISYPKTKGTVEDTAFCIYCIDLDTHTIKAVCYGAGYDRTDISY